MSKPLMPYGLKSFSGLMTKPGDGKKLAERSAARLAVNVFASSHGHLAKGGMTKLSGLEEPATRLIRFNEGKG